jgi:tellurite resistance protein
MLLAVIGIRPITRTTARGTFVCPECRVLRTYVRQRVQRRLVLFFVSMLPLDELGEYVECEQCRSTFRTTTLAADPARPADPRVPLAAEFRPAVLRIMMLMMMEDGRIRESEQRMILDLNRKLTGEAPSLEAMDEHLDAVRTGPGTATDYARSIAPFLNEPGKELVLKAAFAVAVADRQVHPTERTLLHEIGRALHMSPGHIRAVIAECSELADQGH